MNFDNDKKTALSKIDKSRKGNVDEQIKPILDKINSMDDYYTTSSCSGRVMVYEPSSERHVEWLFVTHDEITLSEVKKHMTQSSWLKQTGLILHIACRDLIAAEKMLEKLRGAGFKRAGIISAKKNLIEVMSTEQLAAPLKAAADEYLRILVTEVNKLMKQTKEKLKRLEKIL